MALSGLLAGKTAVVTGAGSGAGRHTARTLAAEGAKVVINDVRGAAAEAVAGEIRASGGEAVAVTASVAETDGAQRIVDACVESFGGIDILVNNAAILRRNLVHETPVEDWDEVIAIHLRGTFLCCRAAAPHMIKARTGRIVNTASTAGLIAIPASTAYAAAKGGITSLSALLAKELAFYNVTVNVVEPLGGRGNESLMGFNQLSESAQRVRLAYGWNIPARYPNAPPPPETTLPTPLGTLIAYLASDEAEYINGQIIGATDSSFRLWSPYLIERTMYFEPGVTPDELRKRFPETLGQGMSNPIPELPELPK